MQRVELSRDYTSQCHDASIQLHLNVAAHHWFKCRAKPEPVVNVAYHHKCGWFLTCMCLPSLPSVSQAPCCVPHPMTL